jgi:hypothetical protein
MKTEEEIKLELNLAKIAAKKAAFEKSPKLYVFWLTIQKVLEVIFWLGFWFLVTQCVMDDPILNFKN